MYGKFSFQLEAKDKHSNVTNLFKRFEKTVCKKNRQC